MLSIGKLGPGSEDYYLREVAGPEEYYLGAGEAPGRWLGSASAELGLSGEVAGADLTAVLRAETPLDGSPLGRRAISPARHVPGFDLTFSAPKSVSLLYGLSSPEVSESVRAAHDEAVEDALSYLEAHAAFTRRGVNGVNRIETSGFVAAGFRQRTSRNGDPQLHTHVLVANVVHGSDGRWASLHASLLYHHGRTAGFVYQAALRAGLVSRLGVRFESPKNGMSEIAGVPAGLLSEFSSRRAEVRARLAEIGASSARAAEIATLKTRRHKYLPGQGEVMLVGLRENWQEQSRARGFDPGQLSSVLGRPRRPMLSTDHLHTLSGELLGPDGLTHGTSSFERRDIVRALAEHLPDGARLSALESAAQRVMAEPDVVGLGTEGRGGEEKLTTLELLGIEADLIALSEKAKGARAGIVNPAIVETVLTERAGMATEQAAMVSCVTSSGAGVEVVVGKAGAGKTYALDGARAAWQRAGFRVRGAALSARAAAELESGAGISSTTLSRLLYDIDRGEAIIGPRDVVVLDEAGMVGSRALHRLVSSVTGAGGKVVAVGDPRQLPEIEAGGGLRALANRLGSIELRENRRQEAAWERAALDALRHGEVAAGVTAYGKHGKLHELASAPAARMSMVSAWATARSDGTESRMYALRRSDVEDLNALARVELRRRGELGADLLFTGHMEAVERAYAVGDEVLFCRNDKDLKVLNGTRGKVTSVEGETLMVETDRGPRAVPPNYIEAGHLVHGYASTVHKAQGATVTRAFVLGGDAIYREAGYVALSRATSSTELFIVTSAFDDGRNHVVDNGLGGGDVTDGLVRALSISRAKELAIDSLEAAAQEELLNEATGTHPWPKASGSPRRETAATPFSPGDLSDGVPAGAQLRESPGIGSTELWAGRWGWTERVLAEIEGRERDGVRGSMTGGPMAAAPPAPIAATSQREGHLGVVTPDSRAVTSLFHENRSTGTAPATGADRLAWMELTESTVGSCLLTDDEQLDKQTAAVVRGLSERERSPGRGR